MSVTNTCVTLVHEGEWLNMAVRIETPTGMLVPPPKAHQLSRFLIITADRTVADAETAMGTDVLEGAIFTITPARAGLRSYETTDADLESILRASVEEATVILVSVLCFFLGGLPSLIGHGWFLPSALQIVGAYLLAILLVSAASRPVRQRSAVREIMEALAIPLTGGAAGALLAPVSSPDSRLLVALFAMWGTGAAAPLFQIICRGTSETVSAGTWLFLSIVGTVVPVTGIPRIPVLVVLMAMGAVGGLLIPRFAAQVPSQQLLDMTQL